MKIKIIALCMMCAINTIAHAEQWVHLKKTSSSDIYVNVDQIRQVDMDKQHYKQAWIKTIALKDGAGGIAKGDYTQSLWRFDCNNATSSILNYVDYRQDGEILDSGMFENIQQRVIKPNSIEENALLAVCDGKYPQKVTKPVANVKPQVTTSTKPKVKAKASEKGNTDEEAYRLAQEAASPIPQTHSTASKAKQAKEVVTKKVTDKKTVTPNKTAITKDSTKAKTTNPVKSTVDSKATHAKETATKKVANSTAVVKSATQKTSEATKKTVNQATTKK